MKPKTFAITGSKSLLKAIEEELVEIGFKNNRVHEASSKDWLITNCPRNKKERNKNNYETLFYWRDTYGADVEFNLPQQWDECLKFCKEQLELWTKPKFKIGDWIIVEDATTPKPLEIYEISDRYYHVRGGSSNLVDKSDKIRLATQKEIEKIITIQVGEYQMEVSNGKVKFGCQYITKEEINIFKKFISCPFKAKISIHNTEITTELLNKILDRL